MRASTSTRVTLELELSYEEWLKINHLLDGHAEDEYGGKPHEESRVVFWECQFHTEDEAEEFLQDLKEEMR